MAYSMDFRLKAVEYKQKGHTFNELKEAFGISPQTFYQWQERLDSGYDRTKPKQVRRRKIDKEKLRQAVKDKPDMFLHELAKMFGCSPQAVHTMLKNLGITRKKTMHICGGIRGGARSVRGPHKADSAREKCVFVDESSIGEHPQRAC